MPKTHATQGNDGTRPGFLDPSRLPADPVNPIDRPYVGKSAGLVGQTLDMLVRLVALIGRQLFRLVLLSSRSSRAKDIELLVLRQQVSVLRRHVNRPRIQPEERIVCPFCSDCGLHADGSPPVTPDTLRRWHRELIRRKNGVALIESIRDAGIPLKTQLLVWRLAKENPLWGATGVSREN